MTEARGLMAGKRGLIMGVANERSIAWGIAKAVASHGAELAFTYQGEALEKRVRPLAQSIGSGILAPCDVTDANSVQALFATLGVILAAIYLLYMFQKVYMGELDKEENKHLEPLHWTEIAVLVPILFAIFLIGIQPAPFFATMDASVNHVITQVSQHIPSVVQVAP